MSTLARRVGYSLAVAAAASCGGAVAAPTSSSSPAEPAALKRIVVVGDSLSVSPTRAENFPAELQKRLDSAAPGWVVTNLGVFGDTTTGGLRRFDQALSDNPSIVVIELGANDGLRGVDTATVERNLGEMIGRAQARGIRVLLCGMETPP